MNIHVVTISRWPSELADSRLMVKMSEQFAKAGHQVDYIIPNRPQTNSGLKHISPWNYYQIAPNQFDLFKLPVISSKFLDLLHLGHLSLMYTFLVSYWLFFHNRLPHLIYSYHKEIPILKLLMPSVSIALELHELPTDTYQQLIFSLTKHNVDIWIVPTIKLKQFLINQSVSNARIIVTPSGYDPHAFQVLSKSTARKNLQLPINHNIIGYIGNLEGKDGSRGVDILLKAVQNLSTSTSNILLVSVGGENTLVKKYRQLAGSLHVSKFVKFIPQVPHHKVTDYLFAFDVCVMPFPNTPHYRNYMSPMKMIEYMASGRPIVTTDLPSVREILNEKSAILVKPDDPQDLARGIELALKPSATIKAQLAHKNVKQYTWAHRAQLIFTQLSQLETNLHNLKII